jgi:GNAT superfamily N-acetyltransferase
MHRIRRAVQENRLSYPERISEGAYLPYIEEGGAWVAETASDLAGFAILDRRAESVWALFVAPGAEGAGIGRALHCRMLDWAREQGLRTLWLTTAKGTRAERFYSSAGWMEAGTDADGEVRFERTLLS